MLNVVLWVWTTPKWRSLTMWIYTRAFSAGNQQHRGDKVRPLPAACFGIKAHVSKLFSFSTFVSWTNANSKNQKAFEKLTVDHLLSNSASCFATSFSKIKCHVFTQLSVLGIATALHDLRSGVRIPVWKKLRYLALYFHTESAAHPASPSPPHWMSIGVLSRG
jgi:hypothetical protein